MQAGAREGRGVRLDWSEWTGRKKRVVAFAAAAAIVAIAAFGWWLWPSQKANGQQQVAAPTKDGVSATKAAKARERAEKQSAAKAAADEEARRKAQDETKAALAAGSGPAAAPPAPPPPPLNLLMEERVAQRVVEILKEKCDICKEKAPPKKAASKSGQRRPPVVPTPAPTPTPTPAPVVQKPAAAAPPAQAAIPQVQITEKQRCYPNGYFFVLRAFSRASMGDTPLGRDVDRLKAIADKRDGKDGEDPDVFVGDAISTTLGPRLNKELTPAKVELDAIIQFWRRELSTGKIVRVEVGFAKVRDGMGEFRFNEDPTKYVATSATVRKDSAISPAISGGRRQLVEKIWRSCGIRLNFIVP